MIGVLFLVSSNPGGSATFFFSSLIICKKICNYKKNKYKNGELQDER